jgi:hypothetical protein
VGEETARLERESLVDEFVALIGTLNETLGDVTDVGNVNVDDFRERLGDIERNVRELTTKRGLVLEAELDGTAQAESEADVDRPSRCANPVRNDGGVIIGVELASRRASIVGVVYRIWITDGQETIEDVIYFRFHQCVVAQLFTPLDAFLAAQSDLATEPPLGFPTGFQYRNDGATASLTEQSQFGGAVTTYRFDVGSVASDTDWSQENRIRFGGDGSLTDTGSASNTMLVNFDDPGFTGAQIESVKLTLRGKVDALAVGDTFELKPVLGGVDGAAQSVIPTAVLTDMSYDITNLRPGGGAWTVTDLTNLQMRMRGVSNGVLPTGKWYADNATLVVRAQTQSIYNGHGVFQRTGLPDYDRHWLLFNATAVPAPAEEEVQLQIYNWSLNGGAGDWEAWNAHVGGSGVLGAAPASAVRRLHDGYQISGSDIVRVRFLFNTPNDPTSSTLTVDELRVKSVLDP